MGVVVRQGRLGAELDPTTLRIARMATGTAAAFQQGQAGGITLGQARTHDAALAQQLTDEWAAAVVREMQTGDWQSGHSAMTAERAQYLLNQSYAAEQAVTSQYYLEQSLQNWIHTTGLPTIRQQLADIIRSHGGTPSTPATTSGTVSAPTAAPTAAGSPATAAGASVIPGTTIPLSQALPWIAAGILALVLLRGKESKKSKESKK